MTNVSCDGKRISMKRDFPTEAETFAQISVLWGGDGSGILMDSGKERISNLSWALAEANAVSSKFLTLDFELNDQQGVVLERMSEEGFRR